uniref:Molybdopterin oxidoreductase n=1 Tax=mine drainage metagenome TaxID=410659 RepID=E6QMN8_9ZZZZ
MKFKRRDLFKVGIAGGAGALLGGTGLRMLSEASGLGAYDPSEMAYALAQPENILYGLCLQCNTQCTLKTKHQFGVLTKIDGNPYSPMCLQPQLQYDTPLSVSAKVDGSICCKGQAGVQSQYDPYRLRKVLKRAGPRGSNKWKAIPFDQAVAEITDGGRLFAEIGEERNVSGFKDVFVLRDAALAKSMAADVGFLRGGTMKVEQFQAKYQDHLSVLIDPNQPDLGPKNNQFVFMGGRIAPDREVYAQRFTFGGLGSVNWYAHTTICEQAHHLAFQYATAQWTAQDGKYSWTKGTNHMKPDYTHSEFVIFWGTGWAEANFGPTPLSPQISQSVVDGKLKIAVIDPRLSKSAGHAWWIPVKSGGDLALALGMIRWIIENKRYDEQFLRNANKAASVAHGEKSWTNSAWLVNIATGKLIRASDLNLGKSDEFVVMQNGRPVAVDPNSETTVVVGDLDVDTTLNNLTVKSGFRVLTDEVMSHSSEFYAETSGIEQETINKLATEFTAHGKKAAIDFYRGVIKVTYGYYAAQALITLNYLIGNVDWQGGLVPGGGAWDAMGGKLGQPFPMAKLHPGALTPFGVKLTRESSGSYESSILFKQGGYPAKRPWFPFTSDVYQEIIPSANAAYPYPVRILWLHYGTPALSAPAGHLQIKMLQDTEKIPLFIATDIVIGETSMYADYVFPDLSYLERWGNPIGTSPVTLTKTTKIRQPVVAPIPEIVSVGAEQMPISMDALMLAIAIRLGAPGYGKDGFAPETDFKRPEDLYLKMVANVAVGDKDGDGAAPASASELDLFSKSRRHLPPGVFDETKWQRAVGAISWPRVVSVLNRGGRFEGAGEAYSGNFVKHAWGKQLDLYCEPVATGIHSITGKRFSGVPQYQTMTNMDGKEMLSDPEYDLALLTYKEVFGGQSRTVSNYAGQQALMPENFVYLNKQEAKRLSLIDGDIVRLKSATFSGEFEVSPGVSIPVEGKVRAISGLRPGTVAISWHYGHWAYGAKDVEIDGETIQGDKSRGRGLVPNPAVLTDDYLRDVCLTDPIAGDAVFNGTRVKLVKVGESERGTLPREEYMSEGPRLNLPHPDDVAREQLSGTEALRVVQGKSSPEALQASVARDQHGQPVRRG